MMRINKLYLIIIFQLIFLEHSNSQKSESISFISKQSVGLSILPVAETIFIKKALAFSGCYSYKLSDFFISNTTFSYYNKGGNSYKDILGGETNFQIKGGQLKVGLKMILNANMKSPKFTNNFIGFGFAISSYNINHEVNISDAFGYVRSYSVPLNFYTKSIDLQLGKFIKLNNKFYLITYINTGLVDSYKQEGIPITTLPAIGYIGSNHGLFINGNIELFYNIK